MISIKKSHFRTFALLTPSGRLSLPAKLLLFSTCTITRAPGNTRGTPLPRALLNASQHMIVLLRLLLCRLPHQSFSNLPSAPAAAARLRGSPVFDLAWPLLKASRNRERANARQKVVPEFTCTCTCNTPVLYITSRS